MIFIGMALMYLFLGLLFTIIFYIKLMDHKMEMVWSIKGILKIVLFIFLWFGLVIEWMDTMIDIG